MWSFPLLTRTWRLETDFSLGDKKHKKHLNESNIVFCFALVFFFVKNNEHIESSGAGFTVVPAAVALCAPVPADPPADPPLTRPLTHPLTGPLTRPLTRPSDAPTFPLTRLPSLRPPRPPTTLGGASTRSLTPLPGRPSLPPV